MNALVPWATALLMGGLPAAAVPPALTLSEAAREALAAFPSVTAARAEQEVARAGVAEAEAQRRPSLGLSGNSTRYELPALVTPIHGFDFTNLPDFNRTLIQGGLRATYTLYDGGARAARIRQATAEMAAAEASLGTTEQAIVAGVAAAYLDALTLAEELAADRSRIGSLTAEAERVGQLLAVGRAAEVDRRRVEAALAAAQAVETTRAARLDVAERELARLMGADAASTRAGRLAPLATAAAPRPDREELRRQALARSPEVEAARRRLAAAEAAVAVAGSGRRPHLDLVGQELAFGSTQGDFTGEWNAGVQLAVPLYTGGATASRVARAEAARQAAEAGVRLAELGVERDLDRALASLDESAARRRSLEAAVASFAEVARIEKLRLAAGAGVQTDYLDAEAQLLGARADLAEARYREIGSRVELARVLGRLSPEWLAENLEASAPEATPREKQEEEP
jgi:outer membrane protein TolC